MYTPTTWVTGDTITQVKAANWETQYQESTDETRSQPAISAGTLTLNLATSRVFEVTSWNANIATLTLQNIPAGGRRIHFELWLKQDGTARTIALPTGGAWDGGVAPTFPGTNTKYAVLHYDTLDGGTKWIVSVEGLAF